MTKQLALLGIVALGLTAASPRAAQAETSVAAVGALNLSTLHGSGGGVDGSSNIGYGGGILIRFPVSSFLDAEFGGLYVTRKTSVADTDGIEVPVLLRYSFASWLSLGLGGYFVDQSNAPSNLQNEDFGLEGSLGFSVPLTSSLSFVLDGRYLYGLYNVGVTGTSNYRDIQALAGFKFTFGSSDSAF